MVQQPTEPQAFPATIGPYRIIGLIDRGGMGVVYKGIRPGDAEMVAVKTVLEVKPKLLSSLRAEVLALRRIRHPAIVRIVSEGLAEAQPWYSMELIQGKPLNVIYDEFWGGRASLNRTAPTPIADSSKRLPGSDPSGSPRPSPTPPPIIRRRYSPESLNEILSLYRQLCAPLEFMKAEGIVHRDLKPSNVMVRPDGSPVILDFGLASREIGAGERHPFEFHGRVLGSVPYVAPEQIRNELVDARADLYALGCMMYEHLTGTPPFVGNDPREVADRHLSEEPVPPSQLCDGIPPQLDRIVLSLLAKRPRDRIGHAVELATELGALGVPAGPANPLPRASGVSYLCRPEIVGRRAIVDQLARGCQTAVQSSRGSVWFIRGESGMGKTYLAAELARQASPQGMQVLPGSCQRLGLGPHAGELGARPLQPFQRLFEILADRCRAGGAATTHAIFDGQASLFVPYEESLANLPGIKDENEPAALPPEAARHRLFAALTNVLVRLAAEKPALLIIDDLQWADELSLEFLRSLPQTFFVRTRLVLVGLYRPDETSPRLLRLTERSDATHSTLDRLDPSAVTSMVRDMLATNHPPAPFLRFVGDRSEGNPFFVAEYLRLAAAEGLLQRHDGRWALAELNGRASYDELLAEMAVPQSIQELALQRLARLPLRERQLLDVASVIGRDIDLALLQQILGMNESDIHEALSELVARQLVETPVGSMPRFGHHQLREVTYAGLDPEKRALWHRGVGEALERRGNRNELAALAYHFRCAGDRGRATKYLELLGSEALARFSNQEAASAFSSLLDWGEPGEDPHPASLRRARWERGYGDALHGLGRMDESRAHLGRAANLLGAPRPTSPARTALAITLQLGQQLRWLVAKAPPQAKDNIGRETALEGSRAYDRLLQIAYYTGKPLDMFHATFLTLNLAEQAGPAPELAMAYSIAHAVAGIMPLRKVADFYLRRAREALSQAYDPAVDSYLQLLAAVYRSGTAEWAEALEALQHGLRVAGNIGFGRRIDELRLALANWHFLQGNYAEAAQETLSQRNASIDRGDRQAEAWSRLMRGQIHLVQGSAHEAMAAADAVVAFGDALQRSELIWAYALAAASRARLRVFTEARSFANKALDQMLAGPPVTFYCIESYALTADVGLQLAARPDADQADRRLARNACRALRAFAGVFPAAKPRAALHAGTLAVLRGRKRRASALWTRARSLGEKFAMSPDVMAADWALGLATRDSLAGRARLRSACEKAADLQAWTAVEEINRQLEEVDPSRPLGSS